jgi:hypothetical protein
MVLNIDFIFLEVKLSPPESQTSNIGPIAGGIGGVGVAIVLVIIIVFFIR